MCWLSLIFYDASHVCSVRFNCITHMDTARDEQSEARQTHLFSVKIITNMNVIVARALVFTYIVVLLESNIVFY